MTISHKILKALLNGPRTVDEIASEIKEERKRTVSNFGPICHGKLVDRILGVDGTVEYRITDKGRQHYQRNAETMAPISETNAPITETMAPISETNAPITEMLEPISETPDSIPDLMIQISETLIPEEQIVITEPHPGPDQYAICRSTTTPKVMWAISEMTLEYAKELAIMDAKSLNEEVILYRLVEIGRAFPKVIFEEA